MSENNYQLVAWTENGEVKFSNNALVEQEWLFQDEFYVPNYSTTLSWEEYERLTKVAWEWGNLLLGQKNYWGAYGRFVDGIYVCLEAIRKYQIPEDGGVHPFLLAMDELYKGCEEAAWQEGGTLEEVLYEDGIHDIRRQLWEKANLP